MWRWIDGLSRRLARRHSESAFRAQLDGRPGGEVAGAVLVGLSLLVYGGVAALFGLGLRLGSLSFPGFGLVPGVILVGLAVELRAACRHGTASRTASRIIAAPAP